MVRLGEYSYHLCQLVPTTLRIRPAGIYAVEKLRSRMEFKLVLILF